MSARDETAARLLALACDYGETARACDPADGRFERAVLAVLEGALDYWRASGSVQHDREDFLARREARQNEIGRLRSPEAAAEYYRTRLGPEDWKENEWPIR